MISFPAEFIFEGNLTFSSVPSGELADQTVSVPGLYKDGFVIISIPALQDGLSYSNPSVPAAGQMKIRFRNDTVGALTPDGTGVKIVQL